MNHSALPEIVRDSELDVHADSTTETTIHSFYGVRGRRNEIWTREREIGFGGMGRVFLEHYAMEDILPGQPEKRAVKILPLGANSLKVVHYTRELEALVKFSQKKYSELFVSFFGWFQKDDRLCIAMEYLPHGDLDAYLEKHSRLTQEYAKEVSTQVIHAVNSMHDAGFAHRDLTLKASPNVLIFDCPPQPWWIKLSDFGLTKRVQENYGATDLMGTRQYMAPETLFYREKHSTDTKEAVEDKIDWFKVDIWSIGQITFRLLAGQPPFKDTRMLREYYLHNIEFPLKPLDMVGASADAANFITSAMSVIPRERFTANEGIRQPWVTRNIAELSVADGDTIKSQEQDMTTTIRQSLDILTMDDLRSWNTSVPQILDEVTGTENVAWNPGQETVTDTVISGNSASETNRSLSISTPGANPSMISPETARTELPISETTTPSTDAMVLLQQASTGPTDYSPEYDKLLSSDLLFSKYKSTSDEFFRLNVMDPNDGKIMAISFSPDSAQIAIAGQDTVQLWDTATAQLYKTIGQGGVTHLCYSGNLSWIGMCSSDNGGVSSVALIELNNTLGVEYIRALGTHEKEVTCMIFSDDSTLLVTSSKDKSICIRNTKDGQLVKRIRPLMTRTFTQHLFIFPNTHGLISFTESGKMQCHSDTDVWCMRDGQTHRLLDRHDGKIKLSHISISPNMLYVCITLTSGQVKLWKSNKLYSQFLLRCTNDLRQLPNQKACTTRFFHDSIFLAISYVGGMLEVRNILSGTIVVRFAGSGEHMHHPMSSSGNGMVLASALDGTTTSLWNTPLIVALDDMRTHFGTAKFSAISSDQKWAISNSPRVNERGLICVWDLTSARVHHAIPAKGLAVLETSFSLDMMHFACFRGKRQLDIWDVKTGIRLEYSRQVQLARGFTTNISQIWEETTIIKFSPDLSMFATGTTANVGCSVYLWKTNAAHDGVVASHWFDAPRHKDNRDFPVPVYPEEHKVRDLVFSPNSSLLAAHFGRAIHLFQCATGKLLYKLPEPDNLHILQPRDKALLIHEMNKNYNATLEFSPDGKFIALLTTRNQMSYWNLENQELIETFSGGLHVTWWGGDKTDITTPIISPDWKYVVINAGDGSLNIWDRHQNNLVRQLYPPGTVTDGKAVYFSDDTKIYFTFSVDSKLCIGASAKDFIVWDVQSDETWSLPNQRGVLPSSMVVSSQSMVALVAMHGYGVEVWDLKAKEPTRTYHGADATGYTLEDDPS